MTNSRNSIPYSSEGWKYRIKVSAGLVSLEGPLCHWHIVSLMLSLCLVHPRVGSCKNTRTNIPHWCHHPSIACLLVFSPNEAVCWDSLQTVRYEWRGTVHSVTCFLSLVCLWALFWLCLFCICALVRHVAHSLASSAARKLHRNSIPLLSVHSSSFVFLQVWWFPTPLSWYLLFILFTGGPHEPWIPMRDCREDLSCQSPLQPRAGNWTLVY